MDENVVLDNVVEEKEIIASGSSTEGDIRNLILSINAIREMLVKCGYKKVIIDTSKATVIETMDGERKEIISVNEEGNVSFTLADSKKCGDHENDDSQQEDTTVIPANEEGNVSFHENDDSQQDLQHDKRIFPTKRRRVEVENNDDHDDHNDGDDDDELDELDDYKDHETTKRSKRRRVEVEKSGEAESSELAFSAPTYLNGTNLNRLFKNLHRLPCPAPTWNPEFFEDVKSYNESLLRYLESSEHIQFNDERFLKVPDLSSTPPQASSMTSSSSGSLAHILNDDGIKFFVIPDVISEKSLLELSGKDFSDSKEVAIKTLSLQVIKIYDKVLNEYVKEEISRRTRLRYYVSILNIYRKIELYCSLHELRKKGETIKNQAIKKIVEYSKGENQGSTQKFFTNEFKKIIRAAKRIERLVALSGVNWGIIDAFPNIDVDFFKSTSISVANFERFLKLVETGQLVSISDGNELYQSIKSERNQERENYIRSMYDSISE